MHAWACHSEPGSSRKKNRVNALVKILVDFSDSTEVYFLVSYGVACSVHVNSHMDMVGGTLTALAFGKKEPGFVHNVPLVQLVAACACSALMPR